jgi:outer membrane protein assembly factor BamB
MNEGSIMKVSNHSKTVRLILVALVLTACGPQQPSRVLFPFTPPTPYPSRQVISSDLGLQELWRQPMLLSYGHPPISVDSQDAIILPINSGGTGILTALNPHNGQKIWSQEFISPYRRDAYLIDSILSDGERIYIAIPYVVKSFSIVDGQPQWTTVDLPGHTSYKLTPAKEPELIRVKGGSGYYVDKQNGNVSPAEKVVDEPEIETAKLACQIDLKFNFTCMDIETRQPVWQISLGWPVKDAQSVNSKVLVVSAGNNYRNLLAGIDQTTGRILWSQPNREVVSNFVVANGKVYALIMDSALVQYDPATGSEIGRMKFSGKTFDTDQGSQYWLLAAGPEILVYLGDSQELIAFSYKQ